MKERENLRQLARGKHVENHPVFYPTLDLVGGRILACHSDSCLELGPSGWTEGPTTLHGRSAHSSAVVPGGLLLVGGVDSPNTTELITFGEESDILSGGSRKCELSRKPFLKLLSRSYLF